MVAELLDIAFWRDWPPGDAWALLGALGGLMVLVATGEGLRRTGFPPESTRRVVHVGVGLFVASTPLIFTTPEPVYVLAVLFVAANYVAWRRAWLPGIHRARPRSLGTVTLPLAVLPALLIGWSADSDHRFALQAAFLILAVSDPLAAWVGVKRGLRLPVAPTLKSWVGSAAFGGSAFVICVLTLVGWTSTGALDWTGRDVMLASGIVAVMTTMVEALGGRGWDNFFIVLAAMIPLVAWDTHPGMHDQILIGAGCGPLFAWLTWQLRVLSRSGAVAGGLLAASLIGLGGTRWAVPGLIFFVLSSALSRVGRGRKRKVEARSEKGAVRDAAQVYANGGVAWTLLLIHAVAPDVLLYWGFLGAFAATAADTWATELGTLSSRRPRLITSGVLVPRGTSGAVSGLGMGAAVAGAATVALSACVVAPGLFRGLGVGAGLGLVVAGGLGGALVDSLAGATVQAQYRAPDAGTTERPRGNVVRGWTWMTNDRVNAVCTTVGAAIGGTGGALLGG